MSLRSLAAAPRASGGVELGGLAGGSGEALDGSRQFFQNVLTVGVAVLAGAKHAASEVVLKDEETGSTGGCHNRGELRENVEAVLILLDHPLHTPDLPLHSAQPGQDLGLIAGVRGGLTPRWPCAGSRGLDAG